MGQCISFHSLRPSPFYFLFKLHCQLANPVFSASFELSLNRVDHVSPFELNAADRRLLLLPIFNKFDITRDGVLSSIELIALVRSFVQSLATDCQVFVVTHLKQSVDKKSLARFESEIAPKLNKSFQHFSAEVSTALSIEKLSISLLARLDLNSDSHISVFEFMAGFLSEAFTHTHSFVSSVLKHAFDSKYHELVAVKSSEVSDSVPEITSNELFQSSISAASITEKAAFKDDIAVFTSNELFRSNSAASITEKPSVQAEVTSSRSNSIEQPIVQHASVVAASQSLASFVAVAPELPRSTSMSAPASRVSAPSAEVKSEAEQQAMQESEQQPAQDKHSEAIFNTESVVVVVPTNVATSASSDSDVLLDEALNMLKLAVLSSDSAELELAVQTGKDAVSNGVFDADLLDLIHQAESISQPIDQRADSESSSDDDDSVSNQSISAQSETHADTEFGSDAVAAWAFRIEKQLRDAIQSGLSAQIDEALVLATEYRSAGNPAAASMVALVTRAIEIRYQEDEDGDEDAKEEIEAAPSQAAAAPAVPDKPEVDTNLIQLAALDVKIADAKKRMTDALRIARKSQITGNINAANEQRRLASHASSDVRRFEEQRAALLP